MSKIPSYAKSTAASRARSPTKSLPTHTNQLPALETLPFYTSSLDSSPSPEEIPTNDTLPHLNQLEAQADVREVSVTPKASNVTKFPADFPLPTLSQLNTRTSKITSAMEGIMDSVPLFYGKKDEFEDPLEYLETINFVVEEKYTEPEKATTVKRMVFRSRLRDEAQRWYQRLHTDIRSDWLRLSEDFSMEYKLEPKSDPDPNKYFNQLYNLKQGSKPIAQYVSEAEDLYRKCPEPLKEFMGSQFVAGITDDSKLDIVQLYLAHETKITFPVAKAAVVKAFGRIGRASPFDIDSSSSKSEVSQGEVNAELLEFFRSLRTTPGVQPVPLIPPTTTNQKQVSRDQKDLRPPATAPPYRGFQKNVSFDANCYNCLAPGHYSIKQLPGASS